MGDVEGFEWVGMRVAGVGLGKDGDGRGWIRVVDGQGGKGEEGVVRFEGVLDVGDRKSVEGCNLRVNVSPFYQYLSRALTYQ